MASPADQYLAFTMSSELPPERRGKSFDAVLSQERRQNEMDQSDEDDSEESDNGDKEGNDDGDKIPGATSPDDIREGSSQVGDQEVVMDKGNEGHVFRRLELAEFAYDIPEQYMPGTARWVVVEGGEARNVTNSELASTPLHPVENKRMRYSVNLEFAELGDQFFKKQMFIAVESSQFESFAFGVFGVAPDAEIETYTVELADAIAKDDKLEGGPTEKDSPWFMEGMRTADPSSDGNSDGTNPENQSPTDAAANDNAGGGLTIGAKAGIGVGVGVGSLILIGLAIFFFLRRRKRAAATDKSLTPANDYMRDKEVHAAQVAETPHSPASEDENRTRDSAFVATGDVPPPATDRSSAVATPSSEHREVPHSVAHLVEEGMTDEQIRRLEEEERALDQAIERAGRR